MDFGFQIWILVWDLDMDLGIRFEFLNGYLDFGFWISTWILILDLDMADRLLLSAHHRGRSQE